MSELNTPAALVVWGGFVLAFLFGAIANKTNFCTMGAISDIVNMEHWGRMRMWLLTIAIGLSTTHPTVVIAIARWVSFWSRHDHCGRVHQ